MVQLALNHQRAKDDSRSKEELSNIYTEYMTEL